MTSATPRARLSFCLVLALGAGFALRADLGARQGRGQGAGPAPDAVPTSASSIVAYPAQYVGHVVTITASVAKEISATAFTVDQNHNAAMGEVLVLAPKLVTTPAPNAYITVIGSAVTFDPADVATRLKGYTLDLPPVIVEQFRGKPAILATAVVAGNMTDLTKKPPAPITADDETLSAIMKQVSPASAALRTAAGGNDAAGVAARTAELKKLFASAQVVFTARNITTAVNWSADAIKYADTAGTAASATRWTDVAAAAASLNQVCSACHAAHRERQDDGTYRLKAGSR